MLAVIVEGKRTPLGVEDVVGTTIARVCGPDLYAEGLQIFLEAAARQALRGERVVLQVGDNSFRLVPVVAEEG